MTRKESDIRALMRSFFDAMGAWEKKCSLLFRRAKRHEMPHDEAKRISLEALQSIFAEYTASTSVPARARYGTPHFSTIPVYGADIEEILEIEVSNKFARVKTQQTRDPHSMFVYHLLQTETGWRLVDNRKVVNFDGTESDWDL